MSKINYDKYKLEWYVLNGCRWDRTKKEFNEYPYCFYETYVRPWNVFDNWPFKHRAIELALDYYKGKFMLETLRENSKEYPYDLKTNTFGKPFVRPEVDKLKTDYEAFKYQLLKELSYEEHGRTEYEICVADWTPNMYDKEGNRVTWYYGEENKPVYDIKMDKIDCFQQVLPNADIFAKYVLMTVNGTLLTKAEINKSKKIKK